MANDLRVAIANRPGALVEALTALSSAGINIESFCGDLRPGERWGYVHILVEDAARARQALERANIEITSEHDVDVVDVVDEPGALLQAVRRYSDENRNVEVLYTSARGRVVVGTEDMQKERYGVRMGDVRY